MILQSLPSHQKDIPIRRLYTALEFVGQIARHGSDDRGSLSEGGFKCGGHPGLDIKYSDFKYHFCLSASSVETLCTSSAGWNGLTRNSFAPIFRKWPRTCCSISFMVKPGGSSGLISLRIEPIIIMGTEA